MGLVPPGARPRGPVAALRSLAGSVATWNGGSTPRPVELDAAQVVRGPGPSFDTVGS